MKTPSLAKEAVPRKHNLATFPAPIPGYESYERLQKWIDEAVAWRNELEKELREQRKELNQEIGDLMTETNIGMQKVRTNKIGRFSIIQEILGEDKP